MNLVGKNILITGGLGFIGLNAVAHFSRHNRVHVVDDGSRIGCDVPGAYLKKLGVEFSQIDISHMNSLRQVYGEFKPDIILHLAAQVAVTLSITNPMRDFSSNVLGTLNLLELARHSGNNPVFLYASTNKVYGDLEGQVVLKDGKYAMTGAVGYSEAVPLSFQTPYGCSKGAADQYVIDYHTTYGLPTVVFRQSCIYGPHQYGFEDQGWVAWFAICAELKKPLSIYGDGCQVRDVLYITDLLNLYERAILNIDKVKGQAFNTGGGPENTLSLNELITMLNKKTNQKLDITLSDWRPRDQKVFICDIAKAKRLLEWASLWLIPKQGVDELLSWINEERETIAKLHDSKQHVGSRTDVTIVIPARNEEESLPAVLDEVKILLNQSQYRMEVVVVDDRSTDKTVEVAEKYSFVRVVNNTNPSGKGNALRAGFEAARGEYIVMIDADFSHNIADLPPMLEEVRRHKGLVVGSRITGGSEEYTRVRAFGNIILTWFFGFMHKRYLSDALNGFKVFHRDVYYSYVYTSRHFEIEIELLANTLRLRRMITEYPTRERCRSGGKMKSSVVKHGTLFMTRIIHEKFNPPEVRHG